MWEYDTQLVDKCINQIRIKQSPEVIKNSNHAAWFNPTWLFFRWNLVLIYSYLVYKLLRVIYIWLILFYRYFFNFKQITFNYP